MTDYETVHTIADWYDGPRSGIADFEGEPHYYESRWDESADDWSTTYFLTPLDGETFLLAMEDWNIWLRWESTFKEGQTTHDTHPALPEDRGRHQKLEETLSSRLIIDETTAMTALADFRYEGVMMVKWEIIREENTEAKLVR